MIVVEDPNKKLAVEMRHTSNYWTNVELFGRPIAVNQGGKGVVDAERMLMKNSRRAGGVNCDLRRESECGC
jgi:hypothetical protein